MLREKHMTFYIKFAKDSNNGSIFQKSKNFFGNFISFSSSIHLLVIKKNTSNLNFRAINQVTSLGPQNENI